jgi:two-component system sensor histidine kinase KdpD
MSNFASPEDHIDTKPSPNRGKLRIFFSYSSQAGKTTAMLQAARDQDAQGVDVCVGIVEARPWEALQTLMRGLPSIPLKEIIQGDEVLREFDLLGALERKPRLCVMDDLAHTNTPGSRNPKRWQDAEELLERGIDVYSTLNLQNLESLNDIMTQITGIPINETVPDAFIEQAMEVTFIDVFPEDLSKRLERQKKTSLGHPQPWLKNFFKDRNLDLLREMALRFVVDRAETNIHRGTGVENPTIVRDGSDRLMVCVSSSPTSAKLVRTAHRLARSLRIEWIAVFVETLAHLQAPEKERDQALHHLALAEQLGAETNILSGLDFGTEVLHYARARGVTKIMIGKPSPIQHFMGRFFGSPLEDLIQKSGDIDIFVIKETHEEQPSPKIPLGNRSPAWRHYLVSVLAVVLCNGAAWLFVKDLDLTNILMIYVLGILVVASKTSKGPTVLACVLGIGSFDFLLVPPRFNFSLNDFQYLIALAVVMMMALAINELIIRTRYQAETARLRERRDSSLYALSRELATHRGTEELVGITARRIAELFECRTVALVPDSQGKLEVRAGQWEDFDRKPQEQRVAQWVFDLGHMAGRGTDTLPEAEALYVPLMSSGGPVGVLGLRLADPKRPFQPEQLRLLESFANQAGASIENERLAEESEKVRVQAEAERLRSSLLSSISHDLRTPLAVITGSASVLLDPKEPLDTKTQKLLAQDIFDEADRLNRLLVNLLEMTKLSSGALVLNKETQPLEEVVGSALARLQKKLEGRPVRTHLPEDLPMLPLDSLLMEQVFINLIDNAIKYTPNGSQIEITAHVEDNRLRVDVADRGPGLEKGDEKRIFEKFYRGAKVNRQSGAGLGLAICRGAVEAHGGEIWAENREYGGTRFCFTLPLDPETITTQPAESAAP